jgi:uncharacterized protein
LTVCRPDYRISLKVGIRFQSGALMHTHDKEALERITLRMSERLTERLVSVYAFGSRVRGDHDQWSDFDVLVVVRDKEPEVEKYIIGIFVDEELESGTSFTPVVKDIRAFELEKKHHTPFYENLAREGVLL